LKGLAGAGIDPNQQIDGPFGHFARVLTGITKTWVAGFLDVLLLPSSRTGKSAGIGRAAIAAIPLQYKTARDAPPRSRSHRREIKD
jgi:hypothetical protein